MRRILTEFIGAAAIVALIGLMSLSASRANAASDDLALVPRPAQMTRTPNAAPFTLDGKTCIVVNRGDEEARRVAGQLADVLKADTGLILPVEVIKRERKPRLQSDRIAIRVAPTDVRLAPMGAEDYTLHIGTRNVTIEAAGEAGAFYGVQTLRQIVPLTPNSTTSSAREFRLPALTITDHPRFSERSMMLDSSRHYQSVAYLKRTLDLLAFHKMNTFHWHLTDDQGWRLEIKRYPKLASVGAYRTEHGVVYGAFYTQAQVRDLVAYAAARHVTIIPEIDMPAHSLALLAAYPEYACFPRDFKVVTSGVVSGKPDAPWTPDVLNVGSEATYTLVENILSEVMELFPSSAIHIGGDECPTETWKRSPECQAKMKALGLKDERALQNYFTHRIAVFLTAHGRRLQGWNEIQEGGDLPRDVIVEPWNRPESAASAVRAGNDVVVASTRYGYFDYGYETTPLAQVYEWDPMPSGLTAAETVRVRGLEACLWTEGKRGDADADTFLWPRLIAVAEDGWSLQASRDWKDFRTRLKTVHYARLGRMGLGDPAQTDAGVIQAALLARSDFAPTAVVGKWIPAQVGDAFTPQEWDITKLLTGPGRYVLNPRYDSGACGIDISEVVIVKNGTEIVARDRHDGFSGDNSHGQVYTLDLSAFDPSAKYAIRVTLKGDGGTDSAGTLRLRTPEQPADTQAVSGR